MYGTYLYAVYHIHGMKSGEYIEQLKYFQWLGAAPPDPCFM